MDINLPLDAKLQMTLSNAGLNPTVGLKLNQVLDAKLIANQQILNALSVKVGDRTLNLQAPQSLPLQPGQSLQLQVVKLTPLLEFKLLAPLLTQTPSTATSPANAQPVLRQIPAQLPSASNLPPLTEKLLANVLTSQTVSAQIVATDPKTVTLQLTLPANVLGQKPGTATPPTQITLDRQQLLADPADTSELLTVGKRINLSLASATGTDKPLFGVTNADQRIPAEIAKAFKQLLPVQLPLNPLLTQLGQIQQLADSGHSIGDALKQLAQSILHSLPDQTGLMDPAKLKQLVRQAGLFLEPGLTQSSESTKQAPDLQQDLKFKLSKFIAELKLELGKLELGTSTHELLKELAQKTEGHLAKLTLDQLFSLPKDDSPKQVWLLELPFFNPDQPDTLQLLIEQDKQANPETGQKNWLVSITITPPELGTIHCKLSCYDGSVNARFWSESTTVVDRIF